MRPVLFVDPGAPRAYRPGPGGLMGLGGTEATVLSIATGLATRGHPVTVAQKARDEAAEAQGMTLSPWPCPVRHGARVVVVNAWKVAVALARRHPGTEVALWLHVVPGRHNRAMGAALAAGGIPVLTVSASHAAALRASWPGPHPAMRVMSNPIPDDLVPDTTPRDPDRLLFASAPHKGLDQVLAAFGRLRARLPALTLAVADPGYLRWPVAGLDAPGVEVLGTLPPEGIVAEYRRALALFMPQDRFAETFGLVIAEANAVGTPTLLHRGLGANDEVAAPGCALIDARDDDAIHAAVAGWRAAPPVVRGQARFRRMAVLAAWADWLDGARADAA